MDSVLNFLKEFPLAKSHVLRNTLEDTKDQVVERLKSRLRPVVENSDYSRLPFSILDPRDLPQTNFLPIPQAPHKEVMVFREKVHPLLELSAPDGLNRLHHLLGKGEEVSPALQESMAAAGAFLGREVI